jgi:hypothetical protein
MTALFIVQANGRHVASQLLVPDEIPDELVKSFHSEYMHVHKTTKGWMSKILFEQICKTVLLPEIEKNRKELSEHASKRALLILDGASSHSNRKLWEEFSKEQCDVVFLPAHSSSKTQPLDLCVNAEFKCVLRKKQLSFPKKREMPEKFLPFLDTIEDAMYVALARPNIIAGFEKACMFYRPCTELLESLPSAPPGFKRKESARFSLGGKEVTSEEFLEEWRLHDDRKTDRAGRNVQRLERKRDQISRRRKEGPVPVACLKKVKGRMTPRGQRKEGRDSEEEGDIPVETDAKESEEMMEEKKRPRGRPRKIEGQHQKKRRKGESESELSEMSLTEYEKDSESMLSFECDLDEDVYPLTAEELEKVKRKVEAEDRIKEAKEKAILIDSSEDEDAPRKRIKYI